MLGFFFKKKKEIEKKKEQKLSSASFSEATISENHYEASRQAAIGREIYQEIATKRVNTDIEKSKGWFGEYKSTATYNINAAKKGSDSRMVMYDSKISSAEHGVHPDSGSAADMEFIEEGILTGVQVQAKMANKYEDAAKYHNNEKYDGMQRVVAGGQEDLIKNDSDLSLRDGVRETIADKAKYTDRKGIEVESDSVDLELIKDRSKLKIDAYKTEVKETLNVSMRSGGNAAATSMLISLADDIFEKRELDMKKAVDTGIKSGVSVGCYTAIKDVSVNKMKLLSNGTFSSVAIALNMTADLKNIYNLVEKSAPKETIREEIEILISRAGINFISKLAIGVPGGAAASVAINYLGNKMIQKIFYSEISMYVRELRIKNNEKDELFMELERKKAMQDELIADFLNLVENCCEERLFVTDSLIINSSQKSIQSASIKLTGKKISEVTDRDIVDLFEKELRL